MMKSFYEDEINQNAPELLNSTKEEESAESIFPKDTAPKLSVGLLSIFEPELARVKSQLNQVVQKQSVLVDQLHHENLKIAWAQNDSELLNLISNLKNYQEKLAMIQKKIKKVYEKSTKLKKRALKVQQVKEKTAQSKAEQLKKEEELIGGLGASSP